MLMKYAIKKIARKKIRQNQITKQTLITSKPQKLKKRVNK